MTDGRTVRRHVAESPWSRWLHERIGNRSLGQVERDSGIGASLLSNYISKAVIPTEWTRPKLAKYLNVSLAELERAVASHQLAELQATLEPDPHAGGYGNQASEQAFDPDTLSREYAAAREAGRAWLREEAVAIELKAANYKAAAGRPMLAYPRQRFRQLYQVEITGSCMRPRIEPGDIVLVDPEADWEEGKMVVAVWKGQVVLKIVERRRGMYVLTALDGTVLIPAGDTSILGVVAFTPAERSA